LSDLDAVNRELRAAHLAIARAAASGDATAARKAMAALARLSTAWVASTSG
jgi:DNA-binding FadR family transcriptional regulator